MYQPFASGGRLGTACTAGTVLSMLIPLGLAVLVKATVLTPVAMATMPWRGATTEVKRGLSRSVTVQVVVVGMSARV